MEFLVENKQYLEILYLLSGPLTLLGVIGALIQLYLFKNDMNVKYKRESMQLTFKIFKEQSEKTPKLYKLLYEAMEKEGIDDYESDAIDISYKSIENMPWTQSFQDSYYTYNAAINYLNELDHIAQVVLSGLASEEFAFKCQGSYFIELTQESMPMILAIRASDDSEVYKDTLELYNLWCVKVKKEKLLAEHKVRQNEIDMISTKNVRIIK